MISPRAASAICPTFEGGLEVTGEAVILADLEPWPLVRVVILVPSLCNIGDIALPVYELGRALNTEAALDLPVDRGDVAASSSAIRCFDHPSLRRVSIIRRSLHVKC